VKKRYPAFIIGINSSLVEVINYPSSGAAAGLLGLSGVGGE
jgi:hypothetical protein